MQSASKMFRLASEFEAVGVRQCADLCFQSLYRAIVLIHLRAQVLVFDSGDVEGIARICSAVLFPAVRSPASVHSAFA